MSLVVNTNVPSLIAQRQLSLNTAQYQKSLQRLSSGLRINRAADDAAGLTISQNLVGQIKRMEQALRNSQDGIGVLQIAEGALTVIGDNLQRIRELTIQAASDINDTSSRDSIEEEIKARLNDIDRISASTLFNGLSLLDGSMKTVTPGVDPPKAPVQIGPNSDATTNMIDLGLVLATATNAGLGIVGASATFASINDINIESSQDALDFLADVNAGIQAVIRMRSDIGSYQNQFESVISNLSTSIENFTISNSQIRDLDIAEETATMVQYQILKEASVNVLAQTNRIPQTTLSVLLNH